MKTLSFTRLNQLWFSIRKLNDSSDQDIRA